MRHRFYESFSISSSNAVVVYGGPLNGFVPNLTVPVIPASENAFGFGLNNDSSDAIILRNAQSNLVSRIVYTALSTNGSLTRFPDLESGFFAQSEVSTNLVSPGLQFDGRPYSEPAALLAAPAQLAVEVQPGQTLLLRWKAEPGLLYSVWHSDSVVDRFTKVISGLAFSDGNGKFEDPALANSAARFYLISSP